MPNVPKGEPKVPNVPKGEPKVPNVPKGESKFTNGNPKLPKLTKGDRITKGSPKFAMGDRITKGDRKKVVRKKGVRKKGVPKNCDPKNGVPKNGVPKNGVRTKPKRFTKPKGPTNGGVNGGLKFRKGDLNLTKGDLKFRLKSIDDLIDDLKLTMLEGFPLGVIADEFLLNANVDTFLLGVVGVFAPGFCVQNHEFPFRGLPPRIPF